jgi:hypothetical protein
MMPGVYHLCHFSEGDIMRSILLYISPWECSPYLLRRVSRVFQGLYDAPALWLRIWTKHLGEPGEMSIKEARRGCGLALQQPWEHLIQGKEFQAFRRSGFTTLKISFLLHNKPSLPEQFGELTSLQKLDLSDCNTLEALPQGVFLDLLPHPAHLNTVIITSAAPHRI